jgi:hypothetical protein
VGPTDRPPPTHTRIHYYYYAASDLWQNFAVWKDKKKKKETPRKKEKKKGEARTAADDREAKRKAVKRGERKKERNPWRTKAGLQRFKGDARKSGGAKRAKGICESVRGLHEAESRLLWLWLAFTRGRIWPTNRNCTTPLIHSLRSSLGEDDVEKEKVHLYRCVKRSKEMEMAWTRMGSFISGRGRWLISVQDVARQISNARLFYPTEEQMDTVLQFGLGISYDMVVYWRPHVHIEY